MKIAIAIVPAALALAGCDQGPGTGISIRGDNAAAGMTNGVASIDVPGMKGEIRLPELKLDASQLDLNGVKLFPGSSVTDIDVNAGGSGDGRVRIAFDSPASAAKVRDYFRAELAKAGFEVGDAGTGLSGTTDEGKPFALVLNATAADRTRGEISLGK